MSVQVLEQAYEQGRKAFFEGKLTPPYGFNTLPGKEWVRGFNSSFFLNLQTLKKGQKPLTSDPS